MNSDRPPLATLGIFAEWLDPQAVERILAVKPEAAARKGASLYSRSGKRTVPAKTGTWFVSSTDHATGGPIEHLRWVVDLVAPHVAKLRRSADGVEIELSLLVHDPDFTPASLPRDLLQRAVGLGRLEVEIPGRNEDIVIDAKYVKNYLAA